MFSAPKIVAFTFAALEKFGYQIWSQCLNEKPRTYDWLSLAFYRDCVVSQILVNLIFVNTSAFFYQLVRANSVDDPEREVT